MLDRVARRHEQAVAAHAAEAQVGCALGQRDLADRLPLRREDHHAVHPLTHPLAAPQVAVDVDAEAVGRVLVGIDEEALVGELGAVVRDVEDMDFARRVRTRLRRASTRRAKTRVRSVD